MKKIILAAILTILLLIPLTTLAQVNVRGHYRDTDGDGVKDTYVQPYQRTSPNSSRTDNYSYPGNYNPNRGSFTPYSNSPRELYPTNPSPYERRRGSSYRSFLLDD
ncbi:MAG: hypothetical protein CVU57_16245 [Deltaproteobacteria bacterium HGW-Deltaproteobacteria-15]|nr:MAG: hypothetical protein CVU57_16245 [Deltaproteobacteria bacterium HGW-Deltaproteobacteria-15]